MTLVILAAGLGSRYGGLKQLDPMTEDGSFIIDFSVYDAIRAGFDYVVFIIKKENLELFRETIGNRIEKKIRVSYAFQEMTDLPAGCSVPPERTKPLGTGHAVYCVRNLVKENFAVINADDFYGRETFAHLAQHLRRTQKKDGRAHYCMVGFRLGNTLTENGTVSRGQCTADADGMLTDVTERTKIMRKETCAAYLDDDGKTWIDLPFDTIVSMNCWGLTPEFFDYLETDFAKFLSASAEKLQKAEYYLPSAVDAQQKLGLCDVRIYPTGSVWQGVTYPEDKQKVKDAIKEMIRNGEYPDRLWS